MKEKARYLIYFLLAFGTFAGLCRAGTQVIDFPDSHLTRSETGYHYTLQNSDRLTINSAFSLPVRTYYFDISGQPDMAKPVVASLDRTFLGFIPDNLRAFDRKPTSAETVHLAPPEPEDLSDVIYESDIISIDGRSYLRLSVLPVTMTSNGTLLFNTRIDLDIPGVDGPIISKKLITDKITQRDDNTRIHSTNASSTYGLPLGCEYVIVTTPALDSAFSDLARFKRLSGMSTEIALIDSIFTCYKGLDNAAKLKNYLIDFYNAGGRYVLLGGDDNLVPVRYVYYYNAVSTVNPDDLMPSDLYYADVDGDWDFDGDGIYGEPDQDHPDILPELKVGRVPVAADSLARHYVNKLIDYYTNPGGGDFSYLTRTLFFTADQMRDYPEGGQHGVIASQIPGDFAVDTTTGVEYPSGNDPNPTNPGGPECIDSIADGYGLIHILAHGRTDGFMVRSANYAESPASYILTSRQIGGQGSLYTLEANGKTSVYYSLACYMGGFDRDTIGELPSNWSFVERIIGLENSGAVGMIANTRWGWVYSSYLLESSFTAHLFGDADGSPVTAMYLSWQDYPYYRDLVYGQNFYGDPTLIMYREEPDFMEAGVDPLQYNKLTVKSGRSHISVTGASVVLSIDDEIIEQGVTNDAGDYFFSTPLVNNDGYLLTVVKDGFTILQDTFAPSLILDSDDDDNTVVPDEFRLDQNYPNPFNPVTTISYTLPLRSDVVLEIFNILGQRVWNEIMSGQAVGSHTITWDGVNQTERPVASGIYFYRVTAGEYSQTKKMLMLR